MLRVMCITLENFSGCASAMKDVMNIGDEFNVVGDVMGRGINGITFPCWDLEPWAHTVNVFDKRNFAILPEPDANELGEETTIAEPLTA